MWLQIQSHRQYATENIANGIEFRISQPANNPYISAVQRWLETIVVGLNLCPFAKRVVKDERIRYAVSSACSEELILEDLGAEIEILDRHDDVETTLLIVAHGLHEFADFNAFLDPAEELLRLLERDGIYQIAHFHPDYQFADTEPGDAQNYTNRSPYPILHLLREESLDRVLQSTEHAAEIPVRNVALMNQLGAQEMRRRWEACFPESRSGRTRR